MEQKFLPLIIFLLLFSTSSFGEKKERIFYGIVKNIRGKELKNVVIKINKTNKKFFSDSEGKFKITLAPDIYNIEFIKLGYYTKIIKIDLRKREKVYKEIILKPVGYFLKKVYIKAKKKKIEGSKISIRRKEIIKTSTGIFKDAIKSLQTMPGVVSGETGQMYVRGGFPWETIIILDNTVILNPFFWSGAGTLLNPDMIEKIDFYSGGFPVKYFNALSGIVDVKTRKGNSENLHGFFDISGIESSFLIEGPFINNNTSFIFTTKRTYYDLIISQFYEKKDIVFPYFWYNHLNFYWKAGKYTLLKCNFIYTEDGMKWELDEEGAKLSGLEEGDIYKYKYKRSINNLYLKTFLSPSINLLFNFAYLYDNTKNILESSVIPVYQKAIYHTFQLKIDLIWKILTRAYISTGFYGFYNTGSEKINYTKEETTVTGKIVEKGWNMEYRGDFWFNGCYLYFERDFLDETLVTGMGIKYSYLSKTKKSTISPEGGIKIKLKSNLWLELNYGIYYQYPFTPILYNKETGNPNILPEKAIHHILSINYTPIMGIEIKSALFYKKYENLINSDPKFNYINGKIGESWGTELFIKKKFGKISGWLSYTYMITRHKIINRSEPYDPYLEENIILNKWFYPDFDQRHTLNIVLTWKFSNSFDFYFEWKFHTGRPYTEIVDSIEVINERGEILYLPVKEDYNSSRYPMYHRLDFKFTYEFYIFSFPSSFYIQILNLYNKKNIAGYYYNETYTQKYQIHSLSLIPTLGLKAKF